MEYWDDFMDKTGFDDGERIPADARLMRSVYIQALNGLLRRTNNQHRVVAYNRPGVHNAVLIVVVTVETFSRLDSNEVLQGVATLTKEEILHESIADDAFRDAKDALDDLNIDNCVRMETTVSLDDAEVQRVIAATT